MPGKCFWVVRNHRHQDYVYRTVNGVKQLRFASWEEARAALEEANRVYPREIWEIVEIRSYLDSAEPGMQAASDTGKMAQDT